MLDRLSRAVGASKSDYTDIRYEEDRSVTIQYRNEELLQLSAPVSNGGHVRCYTDGGKAIHSFSRLEDLQKGVDECSAHAALAGRYRKNKLKLEPTEPLRGEFKVTPEKDPRDLSLDEKQKLLLHYRDVLKDVPRIVVLDGAYTDWYSKRWFVTNEGTTIEYDLLISNIRFKFTAKDGNVVQSTILSVGGSDDYSKLLDREEDFLARAKIAAELTQAEPVKSGSYPVVLDPSEAGVFIHEAFGHLSEADGLRDNPAFRSRLQLGEKIASDVLNVTDDGTIYGVPGWHVVDDEGVKTRRTELIKDGVLSGRMHSRETAADFSEPLSGNMRAVGPQHTQIVRMSNIFIEEGDASFEDMIRSIDHGYYIVGAKGGQTSGDQFTFGAQYGYEIRDGKLGKLVRDINMSGRLFETMKRISMVGNDLTFEERGGCGKGSPMQLNVKSGKGSPHIKIDKVTLGGGQ
ncbi:TldD/PmbA family protein [candidate division WOR-3 bacterium]|uniref:TldD/PmbA family protein n=1 Tax=candidate division WOR-3 bacterium TaxID=2052148 RepID=A0A9D5QCH3_UNCW3|nr:TldD/PmbA family protein [candidate division WOR-3 bacterium]MBD3364047.1 TldD/PmbA family protein [candidate division WOR-3 bacterium]